VLRLEILNPCSINKIYSLLDKIFRTTQIVLDFESLIVVCVVIAFVSVDYDPSCPPGGRFTIEIPPIASRFHDMLFSISLSGREILE
jgi:hypothetical protein